MKHLIYVIEDDENIRNLLKIALEGFGYDPEGFETAEEGLARMKEEKPDLAIFDWMLPGMDGIEAIKQVRLSEGLKDIPIMLLTAKEKELDKVVGLDCGADDYIRKPCEPRILLLRIKKMFQLEEILRCGDIALNGRTQTVFVGKEEIRLTQKEYLLLEVFLRNQGIVLQREVLLNRIWGEEYDGDERTLDTHIRRLRGKIGKEYITTYVGMGYRMDEPDEQINP